MAKVTTLRISTNNPVSTNKSLDFFFLRFQDWKKNHWNFRDWFVYGPQIDINIIEIDSLETNSQYGILIELNAKIEMKKTTMKKTAMKWLAS